MPSGPFRSVFSMRRWRSFLWRSSMDACCAGSAQSGTARICKSQLVTCYVPGCCLANWRTGCSSSTQHTLSRNITLANADALYDAVNMCCSEHERTFDESQLQSREHDQGIQTSENLRTAPFRHLEPTDIVEMVELEPPFSANRLQCS